MFISENIFCVLLLPHPSVPKTQLTPASSIFSALALHYGFSMDTPFKDLPKEAVDVVLYGTGGKKIPVYVATINPKGEIV